MGLLTRSLGSVTALTRSVPFPTQSSGSFPRANASGFGGPSQYLNYARKGYANNEIVFSSIELLATSAAEPHIIGRRYRRNRRQARTQAKVYASMGIPNRAGRRMVDALLVKNGFWEELDDHPLVKLLNKPNPFMSRGQMWSTVVMDLMLAGNAYVLKARYPDGILQGAIGELWRLRPDRVRVIPSATKFIEGYEYTIGQNEKITFPAEDVMHFKTRNPFDAYYGMPPMMPLMGRLDIDTYMRDWLADFFHKGGMGPGAILSTKNKMEQADKDEARERLRRLMGGGGGFTEMLILDNAEGTTWEQLGLNRGLRDALPKEIDAVNEARMSMVFGIPGSILGLLIGYETSSYANQRQAWQVLWDVRMTPLLSDLDDVLNLSLVPEYNGTIDEVLFDLSDIRALQEDEDLLQDRARKNFQVGGWTFEEFRLATGKPAMPGDDEHVFVPGSAFPTPYPELDQENTRKQGEQGSPQNELSRALRMLMEPPLLEEPKRPGRPRLEDDPGARAVYDEAMALKGRNPGMTWEQVSARVGVVERTLRKYRAAFDDD